MQGKSQQIVWTICQIETTNLEENNISVRICVGTLTTYFAYTIGHIGIAAVQINIWAPVLQLI